MFILMNIRMTGKFSDLTLAMVSGTWHWNISIFDVNKVVFCFFTANLFKLIIILFIIKLYVRNDITDGDYAHGKRVCKDFKVTSLGEYYDLYVQSDTLLLADVSENFRNMCLKYIWTWSRSFSNCTRVSMVSSFYKE